MLGVGDRFPLEKLPFRPERAGSRLLLPGGSDRRAARWRPRRSTTATTAFARPGYEVIGISVDPDERHDEFRAECGLPSRSSPTRAPL